MEHLDHMIDMVIFLSVNFCTCKLRYQVEILWNEKKTEEDLLTLRFFKLKKNSLKCIFLWLRKFKSWQTLLSAFSLISQIFDLISCFAWTKVYRQNNHHIDHMVWLFHGFKYKSIRYFVITSFWHFIDSKAQ